MYKLENEQITMVDENGNEVLYNVILSFDSEDFGKSYILIAPAEEPADSDEEVDVFAYSYTLTEDGDIDELFPVETDEEWDMIEEVFFAEFEDFDDFENEDDEE